MNEFTEFPAIRAARDRITGTHVGIRPYRAEGPRMEIELLGNKTIVHNYGHGGSGWSLCWGAGAEAIDLVTQAGHNEVAVIGCGAIGLATALLAQRAGFAVRIYTRELPPDVNSSAATGVWSPDSHLCDAAYAEGLGERWSRMTRRSYRFHHDALGVPGLPVQWIDAYALSDNPLTEGVARAEGEPEYGAFAHLASDLLPLPEVIDASGTPFSERFVARYPVLMFNIHIYARMMLAEFRAAGGVISIRDFSRKEEILGLTERTIVNATGIGAKKLFEDHSLVPIRGQVTKLIPQPEVRYGLYVDGIGVVPRSDGILIQQFSAPGEFDNDDLTPDLATAEAAVARVAKVFTGARGD